MKHKSTNKHIWVYLAVLGMLLILVFFFPYSGDDWMWGTSSGMKLLEDGFVDYNGRYLGNLVVMLLTRCKCLQVLAVSGTLFGIAYLVQHIVDKERILFFVLMSAALLLLPKNHLREAIVWTSGFSNYATSTLLLLLYLFLAKKAQDNTMAMKKSMLFLTFLVGLCNCLFIEHITLVNLVLAVVLLGYCFWKNRKQIRFPMFFLMGVILGAVLMFQNSAYHNIASESDELHRSVFLTYLPTLIARIQENLENVLLVEGLYKNVLFHVGGAMLVLWIAYRKKDEMSGWKKWIVMGSGYIISGYAMYVIFKNLYPTWQILSYATLVFEIVLALVVHLAWLVFFLVAFEGKIRERMVYYLLAYVSIIAPLLIVLPIGPRCLLGAYVISYLILMELLQICMPDSRYDGWLVQVGAVAGICSFVYLGSIYSYIFKQHQERIADWEACATEANGKEVVVEWRQLPYQEYIWWPDISDLDEVNWIRIQQFKEFYGIPDNVIFDFEVDQQEEAAH